MGYGQLTRLVCIPILPHANYFRNARSVRCIHLPGDLLGIREQIDQHFDQWGHTVIRHPWIIISAMLILTVLMCAGLPKLRIEASIESFLQRDDPALVTYAEMRTQFQSDETTLLLIRSDHIFSFEFLESLRALHNELEQNVPHLERIDSLVNARVTRGDGNQLIVEDLLEDWPSSKADLQHIEAYARGNLLYRNTLLSSDGLYAVISLVHTGSGEEHHEGSFEEEITATFDSEEFSDAPSSKRLGRLLSEKEVTEVVGITREIVARYQGPEFDISVSGIPPVTMDVLTLMQEDMVRFTLACLLAIGTVLLFLFHRWTGVVFPLLTIALPMLGTFGLMGHFGLPIRPTSQILPSFLMAVGVGDSVHVLSIFFRHLDQGHSKEDSLCYALRHSGLAVVMTSLTTAGSLLSFSLAKLPTVSDLGITAPIGIMLALVFSLLLLPALLAIVPLKSKPRHLHQEGSGLIDRVLVGIGDFATGRPKLVLVGSALLVILSGFSAAGLSLAHDPTRWLKEGIPSRDAIDLSSRVLEVAYTLEIVFETQEENGFHDPETLARFDEAMSYLNEVEFEGVKAGRVLSLVDIMKETHRALNENRPEAYTLPTTRELIAQELLLFENSGSDDMEPFVDSQFQKTHVTLMMPWHDSMAYLRYLDHLTPRLQEIVGPDIKIQMTGLIQLIGITMKAMLKTMATSYSLALLIIATLMILLIGEFRLGLLCVIPNISPIILALGLMRLFHFPLDMFTMLIGSIAIGVAVDDTIHFMHHFRQHFKETGNVRQAVHETLLGTGRALLITSIALSSGFLVFLSASMNNIINFGIITGFTIAVAFLANVMLVPALVVLATKDR